jgi:hypothetical protein
MITATNRKYFIDPLQNVFHTAKEVLVFREQIPRSWNSPLDTIVPVTGQVMIDAHLWWKTEDGMYVDGAAVSPREIISHTPTMGLLDDGTFVIGEGYGTADVNSEHPRVLIRDARRSDGKVLPGVTTYGVERWLQAAPWAVELMPAEGDDTAAVELKISIAKQKWETRLAEVAILREAQDREWTGDLEDLSYTLPAPQYALFIDGSVYVPTAQRATTADLPEEVRSTLERVTANSLTHTPTSAAPVTRVEVPATFLVRTALDSVDGADDVPLSTIIEGAKERLKVHDISLGSYRAVPVIRSIA